jgi:methylated-DNA-[protein]-cysteine S-methyltransferase
MQIPYPYHAIISSPIGKLGIESAQNKLVRITYLSSDNQIFNPVDSFTQSVVRELSAYFKNPKHRFKIAYELEGTEFQKRVWQALLSTKLGETLTYSDLAKILKTGPRAIGNACRHNPIPIIVPCHRVLAVGGLGGYGGEKIGGLPVIKQWLLTHEAS